MKKVITTFTTACLATAIFSSCGTLNSAFTHGKSTVSMMQAPKDLEVSANGKKLELTKEVFAASSNFGGTVVTSYYTSAVKLPAKHRTTIELYSASMNKRATVDLRPRASKNIIWADILLTGSIGLWIDIPTGNLKMLTPRLIDVASALDGKPRNQWLSQGKLKRMAKRKAKHGE